MAVVDDDTGRGADDTETLGLDACGIPEWVVERLRAQIDRPDTPRKLDKLLIAVNSKLIGNNGGRARSGACDNLAEGKENPAVVKFRQAAELLVEVDDLDPGLDARRDARLLALASKSVAIELIRTFEASTTERRRSAGSTGPGQRRPERTDSWPTDGSPT